MVDVKLEDIFITDLSFTVDIFSFFSTIFVVEIFIAFEKLFSIISEFRDCGLLRLSKNDPAKDWETETSIRESKLWIYEYQRAHGFIEYIRLVIVL